MAPGGEPLHEMEVKSLARGRMCVNKVIAEPLRRGPRDGRQKGLRGNSIAFPQAKISLLYTSDAADEPLWGDLGGCCSTKKKKHNKY